MKSMKFHSSAHNHFPKSFTCYKLRLDQQQQEVNFNLNHRSKLLHGLQQQQERRVTFKLSSVGQIPSNNQYLLLKPILKSSEATPMLLPLKQAIRVGCLVGIALATSLLTTCSPMSRHTSWAHAAESAEWAMKCCSHESIRLCGRCEGPVANDLRLSSIPLYACCALRVKSRSVDCSHSRERKEAEALQGGVETYFCNLFNILGLYFLVESIRLLFSALQEHMKQA